jgi:YfiH family protein
MQNFLTVPAFSEIKNLVHGFATRDLSDDYDKLSGLLNVPINKIFYLKQIHSDKVVCVEAHTDPENLPEADAFVTDQKNIIIGVRTADCLPLLVYDPVKNVIAAIHAGYRGVLNKVIQNTFSSMQKKYGCDVQDFLVALGPSIFMDNYEVGDEVIQEFKDVYGQHFVCKKYSSGKSHLDVRGTASIILKDFGLPARQIFKLDFCTYTQKSMFHSFRRDGEASGRQYNFIGMI